MMQKHSVSSLARLITVLLFIILASFSTTSIVADEALPLYSTHIHISSDGLAIQQPIISQTEILHTLTQAHRLLSLKSKTAQSILAKESSGNNMILAAIIPGGLIYLAYQRNKIANAKVTLTEVESDLKNLDVDAVTLYQPVYIPLTQPILVARYP